MVQLVMDNVLKINEKKIYNKVIISIYIKQNDRIIQDWGKFNKTPPV